MAGGRLAEAAERLAFELGQTGEELGPLEDPRLVGRYRLLPARHLEAGERPVLVAEGVAPDAAAAPADVDVVGLPQWRLTTRVAAASAPALGPEGSLTSISGSIAAASSPHAIHIAL